MDKVKVFEKEIDYIQKEKYKKAAKVLLRLLPDYFFEVPASSTGKYHPAFSLGEGGLVRHTKAAIRIAYEMYQDESITHQFRPDEKDMMLLALLAHDGLKHGNPKEKYVRFDHPLLVCDMIRKHKTDLGFSENEILAITNMIESHMGPYNTCDYSSHVLPLPVNKYQKFVHMCDFLASRKFLDIRFSGNDILS